METVSSNQSVDINDLDDNVDVGYVLFVIHIVLAVFLLFSNTLTVAAVCLTPDLRTLTNAHVANLAIADLLMGISTVVQCFLFLPQTRGIYDKNFYVCILFYFVAPYTSAFESQFCLLLIALDRLLYVAYPLKYPVHVTEKSVGLSIFGSWLMALALGCVPIYWHTYDSSNTENQCRVEDVLNNLYYWEILPATMLSIIVFAIICYLRIIIIARKQRKKYKGGIPIHLSVIPDQDSNYDHEEYSRWRRSLKRDRQSGKKCFSSPDLPTCVKLNAVVPIQDCENECTAVKERRNTDPCLDDYPGKTNCSGDKSKCCPVLRDKSEFSSVACSAQCASALRGEGSRAKLGSTLTADAVVHQSKVPEKGQTSAHMTDDCAGEAKTTIQQNGGCSTMITSNGYVLAGMPNTPNTTQAYVNQAHTQSYENVNNNGEATVTKISENSVIVQGTDSQDKPTHSKESRLTNPKDRLMSCNGRLTRSGDQFTNSRDQLTNFKDHLTNSKDQLTNSRDQLVNFRDRFTRDRHHTGDGDLPNSRRNSREGRNSDFEAQGLARHRHFHRRRSGQRSVYMFFTVNVLFAVCWAPYLLRILLGDLAPLGHNARAFLFFLASCNSGVNFFIYAWKNKEFRKAYRRLITCKCSHY